MVYICNTRVCYSNKIMKIATLFGGSIFLVLLLTSCRGQEHDSLGFDPPVFPETKHVAVTSFSNDFLFGNSRQMVDVGDYIVILTYHENKYLSVFEKETGTYIKSFGSYGRGPGEFLSPPQIRVNENKSVLYAFQNVSGMSDYRSYDVENILHDSRVLPVREDKIELYLDEGNRFPGSATHFLAWKGKRLFVRNLSHRFEIQDILGNTISLYDKYPIVLLPQALDSTDFHGSYLFSTIALKPDMSRFVIASWVGCILEIFTIDVSGTIEKEVEKRFHPPVFTVENRQSNYYVNGQTIHGINDLSVTEEFIYAKYNGKIYYKEQYSTSTIAVFDWSGNPLRRYILDWKIRNFIVDAQRNRCYLVGDDANDEMLLGYFDL